MWYETLPPMAIIAVGLYFPHLFHYYLNKAMYGNPYKKDLGYLWDRKLALRDERLTGAPWIIAGLENIPDE